MSLVVEPKLPFALTSRSLHGFRAWLRMAEDGVRFVGLLQSRDFLGAQFQIDRGDQFFEMPGLRGSDDRCRYAWSLQNPGARYLRW